MNGAAGTTIERFFADYDAHDVEGMVDACAPTADFSYVPFELWAKQRVLRGEGKVSGVGKVIWRGMIDAFPDLSVRLEAVHELGADAAAAEVVIGGTQARTWGPIAAAGESFSLRHLFVFTLDDDGLIASVTAYWDGADLNLQLGRMEVD